MLKYTDVEVSIISTSFSSAIISFKTDSYSDFSLLEIGESKEIEVPGDKVKLDVELIMVNSIFNVAALWVNKEKVSLEFLGCKHIFVRQSII